VGCGENEVTEILTRVDPQVRVVRMWNLAGGISAEMTAVEVVWPDGSSGRVVVRRNDTAAAEYDLLRQLPSFGIPVPRPRGFDTATAALVLDYVEGDGRYAESDGPDTARAFAEMLATIHRVDGARAEFDGLPRRVDAVARHLANPPAVLDATTREEYVRTMLSERWPPPATNLPCLLHGDFWPGNVLWRDDAIVAVIDWEEPSVGDPVADLGSVRLDLLWVFGPDVMATFTAMYASATGVDMTNLPLWDLVAALRPAGNISSWSSQWPALGRPDIRPETMRTDHRWFVDQARAALT